MRYRPSMGRTVLYLLPCLALLGCPSPEPGETELPSQGPGPDQVALQEALTFHASFDSGLDADFTRGDGLLYSAPSWGEVDEAQAGIGDLDIEVVPDSGRVGAALRFNRRNTAAVFYRAEEKVAYTPEDWSGTVSFWLSLTPGEDLEPGYCDPIQITDQAYNDAAVWVDFTDVNPRLFRLGVFGDLVAWNPEGLPSVEIPGFEERLVVVDPPPFRRGVWTHVVITFSGLGSPSGGEANLFLDGALQGVSKGINEPFSWDLSQAQIRIGVNYVGLFDELALFHRPLTEEEVLALHRLEGGVAALHD